ncbi:MAG: potassium-transporting ATPase subunit KdpA [Candidatus Kapabacteria bacterium]|nr:potassium-transporting ATPase subunit KdpA [Ignavibacteria bacterium]MBK7412140.1 potassium-transporting ATPase subunit KdpA [Ignavibacteria bacterium]MBP6509440.1 potassium-transporting ATPase subunit KdpA [Candidatus Kapabacteria bacterium]MBP7093796.1 potassium-transporting ATPase subunit KdpA [Candidatus Kapabacteria bacterium]
MDLTQLIPIGVFLLLIAVLSPLLGTYIARLLGGEGADEMDWKQYLGAILTFNAVGFGFLICLLMCQQYLPLNPDGAKGLDLALAFNIAVSFVTNTNWQSYAGETTLSQFSQMVGLGTQNFLSAATGIAVLVAVTRGLARSSGKTLGNAWRDMSRIVLGILLPLSVLFAMIFVSEGMVQTFDSAHQITTLEGKQQTIPVGPAASQIAIKQLGTNGGGYYNANSAHPLENPTPLTNLLSTIALILIPGSLCFTYGIMANHRKHGIALFATMLILLTIGIGVSLWSENASATAIGERSLMEGKESRFGVPESILWSTTTTAASNGSVNAMHSSLSPVAGGIAMLNMMLGEIVFGGVGSGLYGMILFVILTVFLTGLMVGRTPEYLGKRIDAVDVRWAIVAIIAPSAAMLIGSAISLSTGVGRSSMLHTGAHGISEVLYAWASAAGNNGSAFAGLNANTTFYNIGIGIAMLIGRYAVIIPVVIIAGRMVSRIRMKESAGTFPTHSPLFVLLLIGTILIVGALTFFPVLLMGPLTEQVQLMRGGF